MCKSALHLTKKEPESFVPADFELEGDFGGCSQETPTYTTRTHAHTHTHTHTHT